MKLGSENKKALYAAVLLGGGALYGVYNAFFAGPDIPSSSSTASSAARPADAASSPLAAAADAAASAKTKPRRPLGNTDKFTPVLVSRNVEDRPNLASIDPTLRIDLLAKLEKVPAPAGTHNLFQVGTPPPKVDPLKGPETTVKIVAWNRFPPPIPTPTPPPGPPPPPKAVPIGVKYYGWAAPTGTGHRRAFFLDGDQIIVKAEGDAIKGHYKVLRIDATHVEIEDLNDKLHQTLTKVEEGA